MNGEALGASKRLVLWYRGGYLHDYNGGDTEPCELAGPKLVFRQPCQGQLTLSRAVAGCNDALPIVLDDSDLAGTVTQTITVRSTTEPAGQSVTLTESPAGSGRFSGSASTTSAPAAGGDGFLSVATGDTITVDYLDASACGTPNVTVTQLASVDCVAPVITNVQASTITETSATVTWTTNEAANSASLHGPGSSGVSGLRPGDVRSSHSLAHGSDAVRGRVLLGFLFRRRGNSALDTNGAPTTRSDLRARLPLRSDDVGAPARGRRADPQEPCGTWTRARRPPARVEGGPATCPGSYGSSADSLQRP
jgi:hypothetical protein